MKDAGVALAVRSSDVVQALNQELLRVSGLTGANYRLKVDGEDLGAFTKEQLSGGINLATLPTPMMRQAADVHALTLKHNNIHFARWRTVQVPLERETLEHKQAAMDAMDLLEADLVRQQRAMAKPKPHHYELSADAAQ
jgi:hypothetical protein